MSEGTDVRIAADNYVMASLTAKAAREVLDRTILEMVDAGYTLASVAERTAEIPGYKTPQGIFVACQRARKLIQKLNERGTE